MNITYKGSAATALVFAALIATYFVFQTTPVKASTLAFAVPHVATSSTIVVGPQSVTTIFAKNAACTGRAISTVASAVQLSFSSSVTPSGIAGHNQAASTTVFYNNGDYGCGAITAYGFASSTITITEFAQ